MRCEMCDVRLSEFVFAISHLISHIFSSVHAVCG
jgi:hypothetical protein